MHFLEWKLLYANLFIHQSINSNVKNSENLPCPKIVKLACLVDNWIYCACQTCEIYQVLLYWVDFKAPFELWNPLSKTVVSKCIFIFCIIFSCDQAALWMVFSVRLSVCLSVCPSVCLSVCPSVRLSVCHTFLTMFPSSYHHEIFRSYHIGPG